MKKIGIFYGSSTGDTEFVARELVRAFGEENAKAYNIIAVGAADLEAYDNIILGTSTWRDAGLQYDWEFYIDLLDEVDFSGKKVAFFGLGDQENYPENFVDAMAELYKKVVDNNGTPLGTWPVDTYNFKASKAVVDGRFIGLVIDELNQRDLSMQRISEWAEQLKAEF